jgi:hypothetical protein
MSMLTRLTDTQLVLLCAAAQREDRCVVASPTLKGGAAQKVASKLIAAGFVKEVKAKSGDPIWRRDKESGASYALNLTAAGAKAIAVEHGAEPEGAGEKGAALAGRDQAALPPQMEARTRLPEKGWSLALRARLLHAAARSWRKLSNCSSGIMVRPSRS